ncbi:DegV family protein with EDD domain [Deinobacterium chartae]|uniref:DegV family protein with EDD domain n=1 Tax=Deinobacterium chartae TaxID=521158 RepID=A0A841HTT0_9DEIO|nr:DegV family protein [Deinobacterium chartae]MBB6096831.1 DegV family protein with EDD domain [Deinobacterium chartae]
MIGVITDSTCDLAPNTLAQHGISTVPLEVRIGQDRFADWQDLEPGELYARLEAGATVETAPPEVARFEEAYRRHLAVYDHLISVHLSGQISQTVAHAREAARRIGESARIHIVDSGVVTAPLAELVIRASEAVSAGSPPEDILGLLDRIRAAQSSEFVVPTLEYLRRGGRLSRAGELLGNLLGMRPIITFADGHIVPARRVRQGQGLGSIIESLEAKFGREPLRVAIAYAGQDPDGIGRVRLALENSKLRVKKGRVQLIGAAVGAHVGPGTYGITATPLEV